MKSKYLLIFTALLTITQAHAATGFQCHAMAAKMHCSVGTYSVVLQPADCFHQSASATILRNGLKIATVKASMRMLSVQPGHSQHPMFLSYGGANGFSLIIKNQSRADQGNTLDYNGNERIHETGLACHF